MERKQFMKGWCRGVGWVAAQLYLQAGLVIVFFLLLDLLCFLISPLTIGSTDDRAALIAAYPQFTWLREYYDVYDHLTERWHPYTYFMMNPIRSRYINIDDNGVRATWQAPSTKKPGAPKPLRLFMFGGSTMLGDSDRDDFTIASILAQRLSAASPQTPISITNFGQAGYASTQEVLLLTEQLRDGNIPDLVIFYDGVNDVGTSYDNRVAGRTYDEIGRVSEFNLLNADHRFRLCGYALYNLVRFSYCGLTLEWMTDRLMSRWLWGRRAKVLEAHLASAGLGGVEPLEEPLADQTISVYLFNKHLVENLARQFGFRTLFVWQPVVYEKNPKSRLEQSMEDDNETRYPGCRKLYRLAYRKMREVSDREHVIDLDQVFTDKGESYYTDYCHIVESGNRVVVEAMLPHVIAMLADSKWTAQRSKRPVVTGSR